LHYDYHFNSCSPLQELEISSGTAAQTSPIGFQGLKPNFFKPLNVAAEAATHKARTRKKWTHNVRLLRYFPAENMMRFVGHAFRHDIKAVSASGVLTPEALGARD
jgi:hypothetical protein